jgi:hypothetical protein
MADISILEEWTGIDIEKFAKPFTQDDDGAQRRLGCRASVVKQLGENVNHLLRKQPRIIFSKIIPDSMGDNTGLDPILQWRYWDNSPNGSDLVVKVVYLPRTAGSGSAVIMQDPASNILGYSNSYLRDDVNISDSNYYEGLKEGFFVIPRNTSSNAMATDGITTTNGIRLLGIAVQEYPHAVLYTDRDIYVNTNLVAKGEKILDEALEDLTTGMHHCRKDRLPVFGRWSAIGVTSTPASSDHTALVISNTAYANLFDVSVGDRTANSPGFCGSAWYAGIGNMAAKNGNKVPVKCRVLCKPDDATNVVFVGPDHYSDNNCLIEIPAGGVLNWYGDDTSIVYLNSNSGWTDETTARNKIDVMGAVDSNTSYFYGVVTEITYDGE